VRHRGNGLWTELYLHRARSTDKAARNVPEPLVQSDSAAIGDLNAEAQPRDAGVKRDRMQALQQPAAKAKPAPRPLEAHRYLRHIRRHESVAVANGREQSVPRCAAAAARAVLRDEPHIAWAAPILEIKSHGGFGEDIFDEAARRRVAPAHGLVERNAQRRLIGSGRPNDRHRARRGRINGTRTHRARNLLNQVRRDRRA
jgi:hypothetical protein